MQLNTKIEPLMNAQDQRREMAACEIYRPPSPPEATPAPGSAASAPAAKLRWGDGADREAEFAT